MTNIVGPGHHPGTNETASRPTPVATGKPFDAWFAQCDDDGTGGTQVDEMWLNQIVDLLRTAIRKAGATESVETSGAMIAEAMSRCASGGIYGVEGGIANAYSLTASGIFQAPLALFDGMLCLWTPGNPNTGAATLNAWGLGVKAIRNRDDSALVAGDLGADPVLTRYSTAGASGAGAHILLPSWRPKAVTGSSVGLKIVNDGSTPNTKLLVTADEMVLVSAGGSSVKRSAVSLTIDCTTTGANALDTGSLANTTWYAVWAIDNGTTTAGLVSTSASAPTLPAGYGFKKFLGYFRTDSSAHFLRMMKRGRHTQYVVVTGSNVPHMVVLSSGTAGTYSTTAPTWSTIAMGTFVPPDAVEIDMLITSGYSGGSAANISIAPNDNYAGSASANPPLSSSGFVRMMLESTNIYWVSSAAGGAALLLGWSDASN